MAKFYNWHNEPFVPVEFAVAAYRFGHSQVRPSYRASSWWICCGLPAWLDTTPSATLSRPAPP
jgi:hypothetical protein